MIEKLRETSEAALWFASPLWLAVTTQEPTAVIVSVEPDTVQPSVAPTA